MNSYNKIRNIDSYSHVRGESIYVDDIDELSGTLYANLFYSPIAKGVITNLDVSEAESMNGIVKVITSKDIPGENQIGGIIPDENLLAIDELHYIGHPIAIIIAQDELSGKIAAGHIKLEYNEQKPITDPRDAVMANSMIQPPSIYVSGNVDDNWINCEFIVEGQGDIGGQEHLYIETQGAYAIPIENNCLKVYSSTQSPTVVQKTIATILDISMNKIEVDVRRLGGGFGGKEDQATSWACMVSLASYLLKKPVKLVLHRMDDMKLTGKRHPYTFDYKLGADKSGKLIAFEALIYQNSGAVADLSPAVLGRTLTHVTNAYYIPNVRATGYACKTNLPPNTAFRGFGGPQGFFIIESALNHLAEKMKTEKYKIQRLNLFKDGDVFHYGQTISNPQLERCWAVADEKYNFRSMIDKINIFNANNFQFKKGYSIQPICFGISFNLTSMNQAGALVNIYRDGSIGVSTGAIEMGQGVNTRILQVPSTIFSLPISNIKIETTNTTRVINTSPTAASSGHDLNGKATEVACMSLLNRLKVLIGDKLKISDLTKIRFDNGNIFVNDKIQFHWNDLIELAYSNRIDLSAHGFYATPDIHFDSSTNKGHPFAYHSFGICFTEVTLDCLRGIYTIDVVKVVHDFGKSMNPIIDMGQMEGGIVQGIGWMTSEELQYDATGILKSNSLSTYKIPDIQAVPRVIDVHFLEDADNQLGLFKSKAIGEPPLLYGLSVYFAIRLAILAFNPNSKIRYNAPLTPEKVLLNLYYQ